MDDTQMSARGRKNGDRANRATVRQIGTVLTVTGNRAVVDVAGETIPVVIPVSVLGVTAGATIRLQRSNTPVIESVLSVPLKVPGASGAWSWWYKDFGSFVELHYAYNATLTAGGTATLSGATIGMPAGLIPDDDVPLASYGQGTVPTVARIGTSGAFTIKNAHTASITTLIAHGFYSKA